ncbi:MULTISPECIES: alpha/beta hydrolase [Actinomadura]|uniref:Alpha/beta hydrolase n=1 Tax=Actinomadura yumaensis TaxID=111807 RepID=A0ABW2CLY0_9ACTN|nr:alpha/beta hydrolase [Actinomadura sp. J1-007]MWK37849.1 alpha/beta fold hydrolase [Actinomadura sp. J1-007]
MRTTPLAAVLAAAAAVPALAVPASAASRPSPTARFQHQRLVWGPCSPGQQELNEAGAQCARVTVPLDYAAPGGRTIQIAVSRVPARDKAHRRGVLLSNPGGPGGTGLDYTLSLRPALKGAADRYDLIGFDPRFLGESTPITCDPAPPPSPPGATSPRADFEASVRDARATAERCGAHGGNTALLPHASSRNVARDMDVIRAALGERRLSYYGTSYGADLGAVYAQMFPRHTDRIVIDSSTDGHSTQYELFRQAGGPLESGLDEWAAWTARHSREYRLGTTPARVRAGVQRLLARAETRPITVAGQPLNAPLLRLYFRQLVQHTENDPALARSVRTLTDAAAGRPVTPDADLAGFLRLAGSSGLADLMVGGALFMCGDGGWPAGGWPRDPERYWANMQRGRADQPVFGPLVNGMIAPCAFWPVAPREPAVRIGNAVPVLMLQARRDNNVPYPGAVALHRKLAGSRLVTVDIRSHGVFGRGLEGKRPVPCADRAVAAYLSGGPLPHRDSTCPAPRDSR